MASKTPGIAEFARIQSDFEETEIESAINDCMSSNYKFALLLIGTKEMIGVTDLESVGG